jgi:D-alanyl-D-alanine dipeptidase
LAIQLNLTVPSAGRRALTAHAKMIAALAVPLLALLMLAPARSEQIMPIGFVDAATIVEGLVVDMRYFGTDNFVGARIDSYQRPRCLLTRRATTALAAVQRDLADHGVGLKVFDCYRPTSAVAHFVRWARDPADVKRKQDFYPQHDKRDLFGLGYIASRSGHSRGSTVDLTLARIADGKELDMGTPFDFFGRKSWPSDRSVSPAVWDNRGLLSLAMRRRGFRPNPREWWHFTLRDEPFPSTYFDFPVR